MYVLSSLCIVEGITTPDMGSLNCKINGFDDVGLSDGVLDSSGIGNMFFICSNSISYLGLAQLDSV